MGKNISFSIIVPTYNEESDIARTLSALEVLEYEQYEVIVVDGRSHDRTVEIVESYTKRLPYFSLLFEQVNYGVSAARNIGIQAARHDVLVILNADVILPPNYLHQLEPYYQQGYEWVAVVDRVMNLETAYARFIESEAYIARFVKKNHWVWTEGFSCTKKAALSVGCFPEKMPGCGGEDGVFGEMLEKSNKGLRALDIIAPHIAPCDFDSFYRAQIVRGRGRTFHYFFVKHYTFTHVVVDTLLSSIVRIMKMLSVLFPLAVVLRLSRYSKRGSADVPIFLYLFYLREAVLLRGMWEALLRVAARAFKTADTPVP
ncbi:MAG: glycosyltransferase family 2 protein [Patescibacteria group bacterium]